MKPLPYTRLDLYKTRDGKVIVHYQTSHQDLVTKRPANDSHPAMEPMDQIFHQQQSADQERPAKSGDHGGKVLIFNPKSGDFHTDSQYDAYTPTLEAYVQERKIYGLIGLLDFPFARYLIFITKRKIAAAIGDKTIYQIADIQHECIFRQDYLSLDEEQQEKESLDSIMQLFQSQSSQFYFSYDYDLTNRSSQFLHRLDQYNHNTFNEGHAGNSFFHLANSDFWWNKALQHSFLESEDCHDFVLPIISGYVGYLPAQLYARSDTDGYDLGNPINSQSGSSLSAELNMQSAGAEDQHHQEDSPPDVLEDVDIVLITRISKNRAGTRYTRRGLDIHGNSAMFCETEMVVRNAWRLCSFVLVRGSVPWLWFQSADGQWKPDIIKEDSRSKQAQDAMRRHFERLVSHYQSHVTCVDLLSFTAFESPLSIVYEQRLRKLYKLRRTDSSLLNESTNKKEQLVVGNHSSTYALPMLSSQTSPISYHKFDMNAREKPRERWLEFSRFLDSTVVEQGCFVASASMASNMHDSHISGDTNFSFSENDKKMYSQAEYGASRSDTNNSKRSVAYSVPSFEIQEEQKGIFRVNCLDCLDRTNIISSWILLKALPKLLQKCGGYTPWEDLADNDPGYHSYSEIFQESLSNVICTMSASRHFIHVDVGRLRTILGSRGAHLWQSICIANGYSLSTYYAGTKALNQTILYYNSSRGRDSALRKRIYDGMYAMGRYYMNLYADSYKQDAIDIFLQNHRNRCTQYVCGQDSRDNAQQPNASSSQSHHVTEKQPAKQTVNMHLYQPGVLEMNSSFSRQRTLSSSTASDSTSSLPLLSTQEYSKQQLLLQRRQTKRILSSNYSNRSYAILANRLSTLTPYLLLLHGTYAPRVLNSKFDWVFMFIWLWILTAWRYLLATLSMSVMSSGATPHMTVRVPKSGVRCWQGDHCLIEEAEEIAPYETENKT